MACVTWKFECIAAIDCGLPSPLENAKVTSPAPTTYGSNVTYTCARGFWFQRGVFMMTSTCDEQGHWTVHTTDYRCTR